MNQPSQPVGPHSPHYESCDMHCKRDIFSPEKCKRRLKTPAQVEALEKFYNEHKYPSESMKLQFAKQIGLSEKQVSGWFCHRRLKDKKLLQGEIYANGKQNLSNGAIHDPTSGLRQESCNSTKQGDMHFDSKEVESKRFYGYNSSVAVPASAPRGQPAHVERYGVADDGSSGSSTASHERLLQQDVNLYATNPSRYSFCDDNYMSMDTNGVKRRGHMMHTRCSYLHAEIESPAVSLVKLKLGKQYHEDGPPLGVDFDPLPPGAFGSPVRDSNCEPYYVGDSIQLGSCSIPMIIKEPKMYDKHRCDRISSGLFPEGSGYNRKLQGFHLRNEFTGCQFTPKASVTKNNDHAPNRTFIKDKGKDSAGEASDDYRRNNGKCFKYRVEGGFDKSVGHHFHLNGMEANASKSLPYPHPDYNYSAPVVRRDELFGANFSKPAHKNNGFLNIEGIMQPRRPLKALKKKINKGKRTDENHISVRPEMLITSDTTMARKVRGIKFQQQNFVMKSSEKSAWTKPIIRYSGDRAASSSEDETGGTTSSVD